MLGKAGLKKGTAFIKKRLPLSFYASNESKSVLARDLGDCRDNLRNSRSVFLIVLSFFHLGIKDQTGEITEDQSGAGSCGTGSETTFEDA